MPKGGKVPYKLICDCFVFPKLNTYSLIRDLFPSWDFLPFLDKPLRVRFFSTTGLDRNNKSQQVTCWLLLSAVGMTGFEPAAPTSLTWCANRAALHPEME